MLHSVGNQKIPHGFFQTYGLDGLGMCFFLRRIKFFLRRMWATIYQKNQLFFRKIYSNYIFLSIRIGVAKVFFHKNIPIEIIVECTGLSIEEVNIISRNTK